MNKKKYFKVLGISLVVFILDQLTKMWVVAKIPFGTQKTIWEGFFDLVHVRNEGAAFGILSNWNSGYRETFFYVLSFLALIFIFHFIKKTQETDKKALVSMGLILGGALGNIVDRIFRGSVVDFLSFHYHDKSVTIGRHVIDLVWPAFNVAVTGITIGVSVLLVSMIFSKKP